jgi:ATP-binding cassette, subfamily B, bacterial
VNLWESTWPIARAGDAMAALAAHASLPIQRSTLPSPVSSTALEKDPETCREWISSTASCLGLDAEPSLITYGSFSNLLNARSALLQINYENGPRLLAIIGSRWGNVTLIPPQLIPVRIPVDKLRSAIASGPETEIRSSLTCILDDANITEPSRSRCLQSMIDERLRALPVAQVWKLGLPASTGLWAQVRSAGLPKYVATFLGAYGLDYGLWIVSWFLVGKWALQGQFDIGWLFGWTLLLVTIIPIRMVAMWYQAKVAISGSSLVMRLLLEGSFKLRPEEVRCSGVGQILGRVFESEALQSLALTGGLTALVAVIELVVSGVVLATGAQAPWVAFLLLIWTTVAAVLVVLYHRRRREWTCARIDVTQDLVERMVGHRTRRVQQPRERWHEGEDESLAQYVEKSRRIDSLNIALLALLPRGWLLAGIAAMAPAFVAGSKSAGIIAAQIGGILLAYTALQDLSSALGNMSGAVIAGERARDLLLAASRTEPAGDPEVVLTSRSLSTRKLLEMRDVSFCYPGRAAAAINHNFVEISEGDRILLQGSSGSGKSTFVALASGIRLPQSGLLFLRGVDRKTIGDRNWRRLTAAAPQFHENHIFANSLAFNLLMGRKWPPEPSDLSEAEAICRELGLGALLDAMPAGLMQMVGESGWQLSNGEKSRIYLARTLLQRADLVVLDETFAALDPETAQQAIDCVMRRAPTVLCAAHP